MCVCQVARCLPVTGVGLSMYLSSCSALRRLSWNTWLLCEVTSYKGRTKRHRRECQVSWEIICNCFKRLLQCSQDNIITFPFLVNLFPTRKLNWDHKSCDTDVGELAETASLNEARKCCFKQHLLYFYLADTISEILRQNIVKAAWTAQSTHFSVCFQSSKVKLI